MPPDGHSPLKEYLNFGTRPVHPLGLNSLEPLSASIQARARRCATNVTADGGSPFNVVTVNRGGRYLESIETGDSNSVATR